MVKAIKTLGDLNAALKEIDRIKKAIADFKISNFEIDKFYRWSNPSRGKGGRMQCVFIHGDEAVLRNHKGLTVVKKKDLIDMKLRLTS
ncbi:hypothetical protein Ab1vBOLIVR5_gp126 [Agrobacterium phage OLIVR5]|uniref:Uncharacterized protein n=1 Tax=Agrobacterium phage OLIVR5 TaxID=2723773 RepID=A0A858MSM9_9CAUD|nr:hypothetical protein KNU99_gp126 [Agrobacterium phage OLIVR5]QIW87774.1 hypothetical protein Ab1vBOLIVR5_gp126 [Agrobacterium phage OLIVR5]QIW88038.1 hypothetical protein Ab1vBOLIVR6_gp131 [Agrobacterium phage OLIVR6]